MELTVARYKNDKVSREELTRAVHLFLRWLQENLDLTEEVQRQLYNENTSSSQEEDESEGKNEEETLILPTQSWLLRDLQQTVCCKHFQTWLLWLHSDKSRQMPLETDYQYAQKWQLYVTQVLEFTRQSENAQIFSNLTLLRYSNMLICSFANRHSCLNTGSRGGWKKRG
jgi:hypothetical protein